MIFETFYISSICSTSMITLAQQQQQQPYYGNYTGQAELAISSSMELNNTTEHSLTACMS